MDLMSLLRNRAEEHEDKTFLYFQDDEWSYRSLLETALRIGGGLKEAGIQPGDRVALLLPNCPEFLLAWFGIMAARAVVVPINSLLKAGEVQFILANSESRCLITTEALLPAVNEVRDRCPHLSTVFSLDGGDNADFFVDLADALPLEDEPPPDEDDTAAIIYTSGTTGHPKGVLLTHFNYWSNAFQIVRAAEMTDRDRFLCILPLFHVNAQVVTTLAPLFAGGSMVLLERFSPQDFLPAIDRYQPTAFSAVPTVYAILNRLPGAAGHNLGSLRFCICGAAPMPVEVFKTFEETYKAFILEGYGLSEGTCASSLNPLHGKRKIGSIGIPLPEQELRIVDDRLQPLPSGQVGEIQVSGPNVMEGYFRNEVATAQTLRDGWLCTGDLGYKDEDGYFFIVGRKKEMIIRGGENIYPKEIEEVLYRHPAIAEAAVCGVPDVVWGEEVVMFLILKEGAALAPEEALTYCRQHLADFKCPRRAYLLHSFPKTATGKIQKNKLVKALTHNELEQYR